MLKQKAFGESTLVSRTMLRLCSFAFACCILIAMAAAAAAQAQSLASSRQLRVPRRAIRSVAVNVPSIISLNVSNLYDRKKAATTGADDDDDEKGIIASCDLLAHISGIKPDKVYEARVSFAGSPPVQYELLIVSLKELSSSSSMSPVSEEQQPTGKDKIGDRRSVQNRRLLDTERVQFLQKAAKSAGFQQQQQRQVGEPLLLDETILRRARRFEGEDEGTEDMFAASKSEVKYALIEDFVSRFSVPVGAWSSGGAKEQKRAGEEEKDEDGSYLISFTVLEHEGGGGEESDSSSTATALCVRVRSWGVPSLEFVAANSRDRYSNVRFVITVDEMVFGALPMSAVPSVLMAAFLVCFALRAVLPRILKAI